MRVPLVIVIIAALTVSACAAPASSAPAPPPASPPATQTPAVSPLPSVTPTDAPPIFPAGEFGEIIIVKDVPAHPDVLNGGWNLTFSLGGALTVALGDEQVVTGTYLVSGPTLTLIETGGRLACYHDDESWRKAEYRWVFGANQLTLTTSTDPCPGRRLVLTAHSLISRR